MLPKIASFWVSLLQIRFLWRYWRASELPLTMDTADLRLAFCCQRALEMGRRTSGMFWKSLTQLERYPAVKLIPAAAGTFGYLEDMPMAFVLIAG